MQQQEVGLPAGTSSQVGLYKTPLSEDGLYCYRDVVMQSLGDYNSAPVKQRQSRRCNVFGKATTFHLIKARMENDMTKLLNNLFRGAGSVINLMPRPTHRNFALFVHESDMDALHRDTSKLQADCKNATWNLLADDRAKSGTY